MERYPWDRQVVLTIEPRPAPWQGQVCLRIPDWSRGFESTGGLYRPRRTPEMEALTVRVNGRAVTPTVLRCGYFVLRREWAQGDMIELSLPMPILRITSHPRAAANRGRAALQRGPIVYCIEAADHGGRTRDILLPRDAWLHAEHRPDFLAGVTIAEGKARRPRPDGAAEDVRLFAVPYAVWGNRAAGEMDVWLPEEPGTSAQEPDGKAGLASRTGAW